MTIEDTIYAPERIFLIVIGQLAKCDVATLMVVI
jgi:hypothetical protein